MYFDVFPFKITTIAFKLVLILLLTAKWNYRYWSYTPPERAKKGEILREMVFMMLDIRQWKTVIEGIGSKWSETLWLPLERVSWQGFLELRGWTKSLWRLKLVDPQEILMDRRELHRERELRKDEEIPTWVFSWLLCSTYAWGSYLNKTTSSPPLPLPLVLLLLLLSLSDSLYLSLSLSVLQGIYQYYCSFGYFDFSIYLFHYFPLSKFLGLNLLFFLFLLGIDAKIMNFQCVFSLYAFRAQLCLYSLSMDLTRSHQFYMSDMQYHSIKNISNCCCDFSFVQLSKKFCFNCQTFMFLRVNFHTIFLINFTVIKKYSLYIFNPSNFIEHNSMA